MTDLASVAASRYWQNAQHTYTNARIKGCFLTATAGRKRLHLATGEASVMWRRGLSPRLVARTMCRRVLTQATSYIQAPEDVELCDLCAVADYAPWVVYRFFDAAGALLYIGSAEDLAARLKTHLSQTPFWPLVARWTFEPHFSQDAARAAEAAAIRAERPRFNVQHAA